MQKKNIIYAALILCCLPCALTITGCKKFVDTVPPVTQANGANVYTTDATAIAVLTGLYSRIASGSPAPNISQGNRSFSLLSGLSADEYILFSGANAEMSTFYKNALIVNPASTVTIGGDFWNILYEHIYFVNSAIEGLNSSNSLTQSVKQQLLGEAKFMRAFFYFYMVNLYGDVPLVLTTDYKVNATMPRSPTTDVYKKIISDLIEAKQLLSPDYLDGKLQKYTTTTERLRPNRGSASALLARAYLYNSEWVNAESEATNVITNTAVYDTVSLNNAFLRAGLGNKEAIWQLQGVRSGQNTDDSKMFIITTGFSNSIPVRLSDTLLNSFEANDKRKMNGNWVNSITLSGSTYYYPFKYKNNTGTVTEHLMVLRLAEQYLIRAEARAQQNKVTEAQSDLNIIRIRAGLPNTIAADKSSLLAAILHERQVEFFSEWGHRWFDLKRTNNVDAVMTVITPKKSNGTQWQTHQKLYPLPFSDLQRNIKLTQNPGYQ